MIEWTAVVWARGTAFPRQKRKGNAVLPRSPTIWPLIVGKNWRRRWTSRTQAGRVEHWYAGLVLLNNHPSQHSSVSANAVAAHFIQVAKATHDKKFERQVRMQGRTLLQQMSDNSLPHLFTEEEISAALQKTKPATAPGYDNIHVEEEEVDLYCSNLSLPHTQSLHQTEVAVI